MNRRMTLHVSVTCLESLFRTNVRDNFVCVVGALNIVDFLVFTCFPSRANILCSPCVIGIRICDVALHQCTQLILFLLTRTGRNHTERKTEIGVRDESANKSQTRKNHIFSAHMLRARNKCFSLVGSRAFCL